MRDLKGKDVGEETNNNNRAFDGFSDNKSNY